MVELGWRARSSWCRRRPASSSRPVATRICSASSCRTRLASYSSRKNDRSMSRVALRMPGAATPARRKPKATPAVVAREGSRRNVRPRDTAKKAEACAEQHQEHGEAALHENVPRAPLEEDGELQHAVLDHRVGEGQGEQVDHQDDERADPRRRLPDPEVRQRAEDHDGREPGDGPDDEDPDLAARLPARVGDVSRYQAGQPQGEPAVVVGLPQGRGRRVAERGGEGLGKPGVTLSADADPAQREEGAEPQQDPPQPGEATIDGGAGGKGGEEEVREEAEQGIARSSPCHRQGDHARVHALERGRSAGDAGDADEKSGDPPRVRVVDP